MTPSIAEAERLFFEGNQYLANARTTEARSCYEQALQLHPDFGEVLTNLGILEEYNGDYPQAEQYYRRAIVLLPYTLQIRLNLGTVLFKQKRLAEAEQVFHLCIAFQENSAPAWSHLGVLLTCIHRESEAEICLHTALRHDNQYNDARFNLSYILLRQGRYEEAWPHFEFRKKLPLLFQHFRMPHWQGEDLRGKSLIIGFEGGYGDMIQFGRYVSLLKQQGATHLSIICQPYLKQLFLTLTGIDQVFSFDDEVAATGWDYWALPMSLPGYCATTLTNLPAQLPYLSADIRKAQHFANQLAHDHVKVGLAWRGNPNFETDSDRSLPSLMTLAPLFQLSGIQFVSLQKGQGERDLEQVNPNWNLLNLNDQLHDFSDTAALISQLDLVISIDSAVAHLSGALNKNCWVLLPDYRTDWRWLTDRNDSPWYPHCMRLFRQDASQHWEPVIAALQEALREFHASSVGRVV